MKPDMRSWISDQILLEKKKALPVLSFPGIGLLGITVKQLVSDGELQARCMKAISERFDTAASLSNMDLSLEAEAFGADIHYSEDEVPTVTGRMINNIADAENLVVPAVGAGRTGESLRAIETACSLITDRPVLAGVIGPFSLACRLMDISEIMIQCMIQPEFPHTVLAKATDFLVSYIRAFKEKGAHGVIIAEPAAGLLSPDLLSEFSNKYINTIADELFDDSFIHIYHNCGNVVPLIDSILQVKAHAFHFGNNINMADVIDKFPGDKLVLGNIDPAGEFRNGSPESIKKVTHDLLSRLSDRPNFIISSGCDIPPLSPIDNLDAFFAAVEEFYS